MIAREIVRDTGGPGDASSSGDLPGRPPAGLRERRVPSYPKKEQYPRERREPSYPTKECGIRLPIIQFANSLQTGTVCKHPPEPDFSQTNSLQTVCKQALFANTRLSRIFRKQTVCKQFANRHCLQTQKHKTNTSQNFPSAARTHT